MDHPLTSTKSKEVRLQVIQLLKDSYNARRSSNIIFVCGGNEAEDMRMLFREHCSTNLQEFEVFFPEFAFENIFSSAPDEPFDITDFETLVSDLSHAVVVFPEAAGSYAETGYFSAIEQIAKRCILVLDIKYQKQDSFISLGPAKKISTQSVFFPLIEIDYGNPNFDSVTERIRRIDQKKYKKHLKIDSFGEISTYEIACLIHQIVDILTIATIEDIQFFFRAIFKNRYSAPNVSKIASVLVGANYLRNISEYGHLSVNSEKPNLLELRDGHAAKDLAIRLSLAEIYQDSDQVFLDLIETARNAN